MFKINYRIIEDFNNLGDFEITDSVEGFWAMLINNKEYGYCHYRPLKKGEEGFDLIDIWFSTLLRAYLKLKNNNYVAVGDLGLSLNVWIEFIRADSNLLVSKLNCKDMTSKHFISIEKPDYSKCSYPNFRNEKITLKEFKKEIILKTQLFIEEIEEVGLKLEFIDELKILLKEVKSID